eukprot:750649-Hanusia_phi.AAC.2
MGMPTYQKTDRDALEQEDSAIQIERTYREDAQGSTASCWRIQFSVGRSSNQEKGEANASPDPEFLSNLLLSLVVAVRSKGSEVSSEDKSRFSNVVIHQARGLLDMIQEMPILSCAVNAEMQETKRRSRDRSPNKFSSDEDDVRRSKEKGNGHLEAFLNQLHALHAESEEAYPYRKQSNKYDETVSNYLRYAEISRIVQQVSKYGDELCGKEFSDEEKAFEEKISKVRLGDLRLLLRRSHRGCKKLLAHVSPLPSGLPA